jgi:hypothetical protein
MNIRTQIKTVAFAIAALAAGSANAGIVTQWTVGVDAVFLPGSIVATDGSPGSVAISNANRRLRWGDDDQSGLDIGNAPVDTVVDTGIGVTLPPVANVSVTHTNNPINGDTLDKVTLRSTLTLTPLTPPLAGLAPVSLDFLIDFLETDNGANPCANGGANGSGVNVDGCGDIFVIGTGALNFAFNYDSDGDGGDDPQQYFISFVELTGGLNPLPTAACQAAAGVDTCLGFITPEEATTTFQFGAIITTERVQIEVPEPGILGLMGLGLAAMGGILRRRKA